MANIARPSATFRPLFGYNERGSWGNQPSMMCHTHRRLRTCPHLFSCKPRTVSMLKFLCRRQDTFTDYRICTPLRGVRTSLQHSKIEWPAQHAQFYLLYSSIHVTKVTERPTTIRKSRGANTAQISKAYVVHQDWHLLSRIKLGTKHLVIQHTGYTGTGQLCPDHTIQIQ